MGEFDGYDESVPRQGRKQVEGPNDPGRSWQDMVELAPDVLPEPGKHFVVWGSVYLNDIEERPVKRTAGKETENAYAARHRAEAEQLVAGGVKNNKEWTNPKTRQLVDRSTPGAVLWDRMDRAEAYARWRYRGYVSGEIAGL